MKSARSHNTTSSLLQRKTCITAALISFVLVCFPGQYATAQTSDGFVNRTLTVCVEPVSTMEAMSANILELGWSRLNRDEISPSVIEKLAANLFVDWTWGNPPKPVWVSRWQLSLKNAAGTKNIVDIPNATSQSAIFVSPSTSSVLQLSHSILPYGTSIQCTFSMSSIDMPETLKDIKKAIGGSIDLLPAVYRLRQQRTEAEGVKSSLRMIYFDSKEVESMIDAEFSNFAILQTLTSFPRER